MNIVHTEMVECNEEEEKKLTKLLLVDRFS